MTQSEKKVLAFLQKHLADKKPARLAMTRAVCNDKTVEFWNVDEEGGLFTGLTPTAKLISVYVKKHGLKTPTVPQLQKNCYFSNYEFYFYEDAKHQTDDWSYRLRIFVDKQGHLSFEGHTA